MAMAHKFTDNPKIRDFKLEIRLMYEPGVDGRDLAEMRTVVPRKGTARVWWQIDATSHMLLAMGNAKQIPLGRNIHPMQGCDRMVISGDTPDTKIELRRFASVHHKNDMLKVCPNTVVPGHLCLARWAEDYPDDHPGPWEIIIGLEPSKDAPVEDKSDGLDFKLVPELLTIAGREGLRDLKANTPAGHIVSAIRAARKAKAEKAEKKKHEPVGAGA